MLLLDTPPDPGKFFEAAQTLAQGLSQWSLLIIGGSLVIIVSTSYYRPANPRIRAAYFLFIPAWMCLAVSIYQGIRVQRSYVAYLVGTRQGPNVQLSNQIAETVADATRKQILSLQIALVFVGIWLVIYVLWWVIAAQPGGKPA
jgi:hypothetical protein